MIVRDNEEPQNVQVLLKRCFPKHARVTVVSRLGKPTSRTCLTFSVNLYDLECPYFPRIFLKCYQEIKDLRKFQKYERLPVNQNGRRNSKLDSCRHHPWLWRISSHPVPRFPRRLVPRTQWWNFISSSPQDENTWSTSCGFHYLRWNIFFTSMIQILQSPRFREKWKAVPYKVMLVLVYVVPNRNEQNQRSSCYSLYVI